MVAAGRHRAWFPRSARLLTAAVAAAMVLSLATVLLWSRWRGAGPQGGVPLGFTSYPVEGDINADGVLDFVTLCHDFEAESVGLCGVDGTTLKVQWRAEVMARSDRMDMASFDISGRHVVAMDSRGRMHVHLLSNGSREATHDVSGAVGVDRFPLVCAPAEHPGSVWLHQLVRPLGALVDVTTGRAEPADLPPSCALKLCAADAGMFAEKCARLARVSAGRSGDVARVLFDGRTSLKLERSGEDYVIAGMVAADQQSHRVAWRKVVQRGGPAQPLLNSLSTARLSEARVVTTYTTAAGEERLLALDASTGATLWDLPHAYATLWLSPTRLYVSTGSRFDVREAATGKLLGAVRP